MRKNHIEITGLLGKDPEMRMSSGGKNFVKASLAHSTRKRTGENETMWLDLLAFGEAARNLSSLQKGDLILATGRLNISDSEYNGKQYRNVSIFCEQVEKLEKQQKEGGTYEPKEKSASVDEEIPF